MKTIFAIILSCVITTPSNLYAANATIVSNQKSVVEFELENGHVYAVETAISCHSGTSCVIVMDGQGTDDPTDDVPVCVALKGVSVTAAPSMANMNNA